MDLNLQITCQDLTPENVSLAYQVERHQSQRVLDPNSLLKLPSSFGVNQTQSLQIVHWCRKNSIEHRRLESHQEYMIDEYLDEFTTKLKEMSKKKNMDLLTSTKE